MKDKEQLFAEYPDLLCEEADADLLRLVSHLDASYTAVEPPTHLVLAGAQAVRAQQTALEKSPITPAQARPLARVLAFRQPRLTPRRLTMMAAALLVALALMAGSVYAVGTILNKVFQLEPGTQQIALQNLYEPINQSGMIGDFTLMAEQGYADSNRVIVAFTVKKPAGHTYNHVSPEGVTLTTQEGLDLPYYYGDGYGNKEGEDGYADFFDAAGITGNPEELHLHAKVQVLDIAQQDGDDSTLRTYQIPGPVSFDFMLTFHPGRIAQVNQTHSFGGGAVTLERVVVTLSETRVYLQLQGIDAAQFIVTRLSVDGWDSDRGPSGPIGTIGGKNAGGKGDAASGRAVIFFGISLYDKHGEWTLVVTARSGDFPSSTFHFQVP